MEELYIQDTLHVKQVVNNLIVDLQRDERPELKLALANIFIKPFTKFGEAYDEFIRAICASAQAYDSWLNFQMQILTELGPHREKLVEQFEKMFEATCAGTPGFESSKPSDQKGSMSYVLLLAVRVYGDAIQFGPEGATQ